MLRIVFNPFTGNFDYVDVASGADFLDDLIITVAGTVVYDLSGSNVVRV